MDNGPSNLGEQALNRTVEAGLASQLDAVDKLEAEIHTDPGQLLQGKLESANIEGKGLVMKQDLRTEAISVRSDGIAIDPLKAAFGDIQLTRPTNATMAVTLTEEDIERALNSRFLDQKLQNLEINLDGQPTRVTPQHVSFRLPGESKVAIAADLTLPHTGETRRLAFTTVPEVGPGGHQVLLKQVEQVEVDTESAPQEFTDSLLQAVSSLLDLRNFTLKGMVLQLQHINILPGRMELTTAARLEEFPGA